MGCPRLPYREKENELNFLGLWKKTGQSESCDNYYAFGLTFNSYRRENNLENKIRFQGQEHIDDLDLGWESFKWRNYMSDIGRFFNVDPLASDYVHNSTYAFSENKVTNHIELEGLEAVKADVLLKQEVDKAGRAVMNVVNNVTDAISDVSDAVGDFFSGFKRRGGMNIEKVSDKPLENASTENLPKAEHVDELAPNHDGVPGLNTRNKNVNFLQNIADKENSDKKNDNKAENDDKVGKEAAKKDSQAKPERREYLNNTNSNGDTTKNAYRIIDKKPNNENN